MAVIHYFFLCDVRGAFDNVSHWHLTRALVEFDIPIHIRRLIHNWLRARSMRVKMRTPKGVYYSKNFMATKGLPQGGVLFPILRLVFVNGAGER